MVKYLEKAIKETETVHAQYKDDQWPCTIFQRYPWNLIQIQKNGKYRCFSDSKRFISASFSIASYKQKMGKYFSESLTLIHNSYLIRQRFPGYCCRSVIARFAWRVTWNYPDSPCNSAIRQPSLYRKTCYCKIWLNSHLSFN